MKLPLFLLAAIAANAQTPPATPAPEPAAVVRSAAPEQGAAADAPKWIAPSPAATASRRLKHVPALGELAASAAEAAAPAPVAASKVDESGAPNTRFSFIGGRTRANGHSGFALELGLGVRLPVLPKAAGAVYAQANFPFAQRSSELDFGLGPWIVEDRGNELNSLVLLDKTVYSEDRQHRTSHYRSFRDDGIYPKPWFDFTYTPPTKGRFVPHAGLGLTHYSINNGSIYDYRTHYDRFVPSSCSGPQPCQEQWIKTTTESDVQELGSESGWMSHIVAGASYRLLKPHGETAGVDVVAQYRKPLTKDERLKGRTIQAGLAFTWR